MPLFERAIKAMSESEYNEARQEVERLSELLHRYQREYYIDGRPSVSDLEYDRLFDRLAELEAQYPELKRPDSPTQRVGTEPTDTFPEVEHTVPVLSLDKAYSSDEVADWIHRTSKRSGQTLSFVVEEKIDGVAIVLYYKAGRLMRAVTRGNGFVGNDITANVKTIRTVPLRLPEAIDVAVRGEIYLPKDRFEELNRKMETPYANPRNLAAGSLRRIKSSEVARIPLNMFAYEAAFPQQELSHIEVLEKLTALQFRVSRRIGVFSNRLDTVDMEARCPEWSFGKIDELPQYIEQAASERDALEYEIDGLVVKVNELQVREELGYTGHHPRWAIAYKFESPQGTTNIKTIEVQVGRTGRITPVARVEPVQIGGSTISNVTLHNQAYIEILEIAEGDQVTVSRRGDVIPAVEKVVQKNEVGNPVWRMPDTCPSCGSKLEVYGAHHFCRNNKCPDQVRGRLHFFIGRNQMDIENLGPETAEILIEEGFVQDLPDLYRFDFERLKGYPGFGEKKIAAIKTGLEKSLSQPFRVVLPSLGIPEVGPSVTELLIGAGFTSIDKIIKIAEEGDAEKLVEIKGIGEKTAATIIEEFSRPEVQHRIEELKQVGLQFETSVKDKTGAGDASIPPLFEGENWCVTGSFNRFNPRSKAMEYVKAGGGRTSSQVSGSTTHLLAGSGGGSKLQKAQQLGVEIVSEEEFVGRLKDGGIPIE
ncbi:MAG: NAD-dependent DNA ligase LigA [Spirochaetia bacterium]